MPDTALTIITDALMDLGVLADEETPTASQAAGALRRLNNMIDSWNIEKLMLYANTEYTFPLVANKGIYTLGPTGDFVMPRPTSISNCFVRNTSLPAAQRYDFPLYIYNDDEYQNVRLKSLTSTLPQGINFDMSAPLVTAYLYPVPSTTLYTLIIWTQDLISNVSLDTVIVFPPGYKRALQANLAVELASSYQVQPSQILLDVARQSKADIKTINFQLNEQEIDPRLGGTVFNYLTGDSQ